MCPCMASMRSYGIFAHANAHQSLTDLSEAGDDLNYTALLIPVN